MRVAEAVVDRVFEAFLTVIPSTVVVTRDRGGLSAEAVGDVESGAGIATIGYRGLSLPPLPLSQRKRAEIALRGFIVTLVMLISEALDDPWPPEGHREVRVAIGPEQDIRVWFGAADHGRAAIRLPVIEWSGPLTAE